MKYCTKCGAQNQDDAIFCISCGNKFDVQTNQSTYSGNTNSGQYQNIPPNQAYPGQNAQNPQQNYGSNQNYQPFSIDNMFSNDFQTSKTLVLIAFIFSIIALVLFFFSFVSDIVNAISISASYTSAGIPAPYTVGLFYAYGIIYIIMFLITVIVFLRVKRIYDLLKAGNTAQAFKINTVTWAIIAIIFSGIITGIMLLLARNYMEKIVSH